MKKKQLLLHKTQSGTYRSVFKNRHGRLIYLEVSVDDNSVHIKDCYYIDRKRAGEYYARPKKLTSRDFSFNEILDVVASQLDRKFYGVDIMDKFTDLTETEFINTQLATMQTNYNFLIFIGEGDTIEGIPSVIRTRFKNRIHRGIYLEMRYSGNGNGVITDCHYYDRKYAQRSTVVPEMLSTVYFKYNRQAIINIINNELNTAFTNIIFVTDGSLDINNEVALCGNI